MTERLTAFIAGESPVRVFGLTARERLEKQLEKANVGIVSSPDEAGVVFSGRHVFGASVVSALAKAAPGTMLKDDSGHLAGATGADAATAEQVEAGAKAPESAKDGAGLAGRYDFKLRKKTDPMVRLVTEETKTAAEQIIFNATYKGVTDFVTKYAWPWPALRAVRFCVRFGLSPNQVTLVGLVLVILSFWLFWNGHFAAGLLSGWVMTFLDTVDGKLARSTLTSSKLGDVLDHGTDLIHPPFWWWAWWVGLGAAGMPADHGLLALIVILAGYIIQRIMEGIFYSRHGFHIHMWRPFDSFFRTITARRNPNMVILTLSVLFGRPDIGFILVAVWVAVGILVHGVQLVQSFSAMKKGPMRSWMED